MSKSLTQKLTSPKGQVLVVCYYDLESKTAFKIPPEQRDDFGIRLPDFEVTQETFNYFSSIVREWPEE